MASSGEDDCNGSSNSWEPLSNDTEHCRSEQSEEPYCGARSQDQDNPCQNTPLTDVEYAPSDDSQDGDAPEQTDPFYVGCIDRDEGPTGTGEVLEERSRVGCETGKDVTVSSDSQGERTHNTCRPHHGHEPTGKGQRSNKQEAKTERNKRLRECGLAT